MMEVKLKSKVSGVIEETSVSGKVDTITVEETLVKAVRVA